MNQNKLTSSGRGGKRKGAGRPKTGRTTKVIRVPLHFPDSQDVLDALEVIKEYKKLCDDKPKSSSRYYFLKKLLNDLPSSLFD